VLATTVPSTSVSVLVTLNVVFVLNAALEVLSSATGASFTGSTVTNKVSFTHEAGNGVPLSHTV